MYSRGQRLFVFRLSIHLYQASTCTDRWNDTILKVRSHFDLTNYVSGIMLCKNYRPILKAMTLKTEYETVALFHIWSDPKLETNSLLLAMKRCQLFRSSLLAVWRCVWTHFSICNCFAARSLFKTLIDWASGDCPCTMWQNSLTVLWINSLFLVFHQN